MVSLPLAGRGRPNEAMQSIAEIEAGVGVPQTSGFAASPPDRAARGHPPRKGEGKKEPRCCDHVSPLHSLPITP
jgi:hypothetical protein